MPPQAPTHCPCPCPRDPCPPHCCLAARPAEPLHATLAFQPGAGGWPPQTHPAAPLHALLVALPGVAGWTHSPSGWGVHPVYCHEGGRRASSAWLLPLLLRVSPAHGHHPAGPTPLPGVGGHGCLHGPHADRVLHAVHCEACWLWVVGGAGGHGCLGGQQNQRAVGKWMVL